MGLFNNGMSRYIKNRAPVLGIQKDLFFMSFFFSRNEDYFFHPFSLYITKGKENLHKQMHQYSRRQMPDSEKQFPQSLCPVLMDLGVGTEWGWQV